MLLLRFAVLMHCLQLRAQCRSDLKTELQDSRAAQGGNRLSV